MTQYADETWSWSMESDDHPEWNGATVYGSANDALLDAARWIKHSGERAVVNTVRVMLCHHVDGTWGTMVKTDPERLEWEFATASFDDPVSALVATTGKIGIAEPRSGPANTVAADIAKAQANEDQYLAYATYQLQIAEKVEEL